MMRNFSSVLFTFILINPISSQQKQSYLTGKVTRINSKNMPIYPAQVSAENSNPTTTTSNGQFKLVFNNLDAGSEVELQIRYKNWVVINEKDLIIRVSDNFKMDTLKIYMCPIEELIQNKLRYYNIAVKSITASYDKKIIELKSKNSEYNVELQKISRERDLLLLSANELADDLAKINLDDISVYQKKAFEKFTKGQVSEALEILRSVHSVEIIEKAKREKMAWLKLRNEADIKVDNSNKIIKEQIKKLLFQSRLYQLNFQWDSAEVCFRQAIISDTSNFPLLMVFSHFLTDQGRYSEAKKWYTKGLSSTNSFRDSISIFVNLSSLSGMLHDQEGVIRYLLAAENLLFKVPPNNNERDREDSAAVFVNLGINYSGKDSVKAEGYFLKSIRILESLAKKNPQKYNGDFSKALHNIGTFYSNHGNLNRAEAFYNKALEIKRNIGTEKDSDKSSLAATINNIAYLYQQKGYFKLSETTYAEGINLFGLSYKKMSRYHLIILGKLHFGLGSLYEGLHQYSKAKYEFEYSLEIYLTMPEICSLEIAEVQGALKGIKK